MLDAITNDVGTFTGLKVEELVGKDKKRVLILEREGWLNDNHTLIDLVHEAGGKKVTTTLDGLLEIESFTLPQIQYIHDNLIIRDWNREPYNIENRDKMLFSAGGIMWGGVHKSWYNDPWIDLETKEEFSNQKGESQNSAKFHLLPLGVSHHIPSLARASASLVAIDMSRILDNIASYAPHEKDRMIHFMYADVRFNAARFLHQQYGFRIAQIWNGPSPLKEFPGWTKLDTIQVTNKKTGGQEEIILRLFCTADDMLNRVWEKANDILDKVTESEKVKDLSRYKAFEMSLRKLGISVRCTKPEIVDTPMIAEWQKIHAPDYSQVV
jgi:hypothetical protein